MGGEIAVESELGRGTTFTVRLPLVSAAKLECAQISASDPVAPSVAGRRSRVIIAEDHDINQVLITAMAVRLGLDPVIAPNGLAAVDMVVAAAVEDNPFALVLMDVQMPEVDGLEATRRLRLAGYDAATLPIVALTANAYAEDVTACLTAGMQAHLSKPVLLSDLHDIIAKLGITVKMPLSTEAKPAPGQSLSARFAQRHRNLLDRIAKVIRERGSEGADLDELTTMLHQFAGTAGMFGMSQQGKAAAALEIDLIAAGPAAARAMLTERWKALDVAA